MKSIGFQTLCKWRTDSDIQQAGRIKAGRATSGEVEYWRGLLDSSRKDNFDPDFLASSRQDNIGKAIKYDDDVSYACLA